MPEVVVYMLEGRSLEQKRGLIKDITAAVVKNAGATAESVTVRWSKRRRPPRARAASCSARCRRVSRRVGSIADAFGQICARRRGQRAGVRADFCR